MEEPRAYSVLLVDDHELIRHGLSRAFERAEDFTIVGHAGTLGEATSAVTALSPDVVVTDVRLPDGTGLDLVRTLRQERPNVGIVVLTMYAGDEQLFGAMKAGASAFVAKDSPAADVLAAARHSVVSPRTFAAAGLVEAMQRRMTEASPRLSEREAEVLRLLAEGLGVSAIAQTLFVSESTAKTHVAKIYDKLGAANRAQAIMKAVKSGLLAN